MRPKPGELKRLLWEISLRARSPYEEPHPPNLQNPNRIDLGRLFEVFVFRA
jgi:hypothetical protein